MRKVAPEGAVILKPSVAKLVEVEVGSGNGEIRRGHDATTSLQDMLLATDHGSCSKLDSDAGGVG